MTITPEFAWGMVVGLVLGFVLICAAAYIGGYIRGYLDEQQRLAREEAARIDEAMRKIFTPPKGPS